MIPIRVFARLDLKDSNVVKGYQFEGLKVLGSAVSFVESYYAQGADEIFLNDVVASLFGRESLVAIISQITDSIHIPVTVSGGIRSIEDVKKLMNAGADKVALNSAAIARPKLISEIVDIYGAQAVVVSIEAKKVGDENWIAYFDSGRESSGLNVLEWIKICEQMGAGEIILTSVDRDGTLKGPDTSLFDKACSLATIPIVLSGGFSSSKQITELSNKVQFEGIAIGKAFHVGVLSVNEVKNLLNDKI